MLNYLEIDGLENLVLESSYVLDVIASPGLVRIDLDLVLDPDHLNYSPPPTGERECFRRGSLTFVAVAALTWVRQGGPPAVDGTGEIDYGNIETMTYDSGVYRVAGEVGELVIVADSLSIEVEG